jgi:uncharacterized membrane protein
MMEKGMQTVVSMVKSVLWWTVGVSKCVEYLSGQFSLKAEIEMEMEK